MSDGLVPIGTIIDWWRDKDATVVQPFPTGYQVCDGSPIAEGILKGQKTPDLQLRFIRGATNADGIGTFGGKEFAPLPDATESCYDSGPDPGQHAYKVRDDNQGWSSNVHLSVSDGGGGSTKEGQHRHRLGGTVNILPPYYGLLKLMRIS